MAPGRMAGSRTSRLALAAAFGLAIAVPGQGCTKDPAQDAEASKTRRVTVKLLGLESWSEVLDIPATALGNATINVVAKVPGRVAAIVHDEGDYVMAGDTLIELDPRDLKTALAAASGQAAMARAGLAAAQVQRENLAKDHARLQELRKSGSISMAEAEKMEAGFQAADAQLGLARAQLDVALSGLEMSRRNLADAVVKSPVDGLVSRRSVDVGQETSPAAPLPLVVLASVDPLFVEGSAPEYVLGRLRDGMPATVTFDGLPDRSFPGVLDLVGPTVDPVSKMVRVRVKVGNPAPADATRRLVPGMSGMIRLVPEEGRYFVIPLNTVRRQEGELLVLLFVDADGRVAERKVRPLRRDGLRFLAREGLEEGLRLITAGPKDLEPGSAVEVAGSSVPSP